MENTHVSIISHYQQELRRIAWRLNYYARKRSKREIFLNDYLYATTPCYDEIYDTQFYVNEVIKQIPYAIGRKVIYELYVLDKSETQIAKEMNISQQAVNRWKRKSLTYLFQNLSL